MPPFPTRIEIDIRRQRLRLIETDGMEEFIVSTASNGAGELFGSECTPRGKHIIRAKIGAGRAANTVFIGRRPSGEIYNPELAHQYPQRDWILTRILWLSGQEPGRNRLGKVDTMRRYIYIHGCPSEDRLGIAGSHGCIKMRNQDIIWLFERVSCGTRVDIHE
ncbi:Glutamate synthase [NADPH] large chain [hydrothermal vent metagenome]|uniref:Glutamate synthase [NADPH] large chain n=1 Tax=hydrothermal vent metagenome TaxID=652676 RepID=A0A3B1BRE4_9ZZZZ